MRFKVGPDVIRVKICAGELVRDGVEIDATTHGREILISGLVLPRDRFETVLDQCRRIHERHFGPMSPAGMAALTVDITRQLNRQGGEVSLMRLSPDSWVDAGALADVGAEPHGCQCGLCGTKYAEHQITTGPPEIDANTAKLVVRRWVFCDFCNLEMTWTEGATPAGNPNGRVISGPEYGKRRSSA